MIDMKYIEFTATVLTILSLYFLSEGNNTGFTLGMFGGLFWLYWAHEKNSIGLMVTNTILIFINLHGLGIV